MAPVLRREVQLIFPGLKVGKDDPSAAERLVRLGVGGFCLYGGTPSAIRALVRRLQSAAATPLLFCADYEDGAASHVEGTTRFPSNMGLGASGRVETAYRKAFCTGREASSLGVRWVFAPVLDLAGRSDNPIVNIRAFGEDPALVSRMARAYLRGLRDAGVLSCVKHFPGHGDTRVDSHLGLPTVRASRRVLRTRELRPYEGVLDLADSVMLAHLRVPALEPGVPVPFSKRTVSGLLRGDLGYEGLVLTDALDMRAVAGRYGDAGASLRALKAGADILLVPADPEALARRLPGLLDKDPEAAAGAERALGRILRAKGAAGLFEDGGLPPASGAAVACAEHRRRARELAEASLCWARRPAGAIARRIRYIEPETASGAPASGRMFLQELKRLGFSVSPRGEAVVAASFAGPRAYSGRIRWDAAQVRSARAAAASPSSTLVCFGSPFVLDQAPGFKAVLCAFGGGEESQRAAARLLAGRLRARGRLPVTLRSLAGGPR